MTINLLHLMTMIIKFYMESGIAKLLIDIHNNLLVNFFAFSFYIPIMMSLVT
jgi:phosphatidate phosphatase PAH1